MKSGKRKTRGTYTHYHIISVSVCCADCKKKERGKVEGEIVITQSRN